MNLTKYYNGTYEEEAALYNEDTKEVITHGDYYHDKIDEYIKGIIRGIKYCNIDVNLQEKTIMPRNKLFKICGFNNNKD